MKFSVSVDTFARALSLVGKAIANRTTLPVLSGVYMDLNGNKLTLLGNNTEIAVKTIIDVATEEEGTFVVPARLLIDFVNTLSIGSVRVETNENALHITAGKTKSNFTGLDSEDYPEISFDRQQTTYELPSKQLADAIDRIGFSASTDEARAILTGVSIRAEKGTIEVAATDGFRLSVEKFPSTAADKSFSVVIPAKVVQEVVKSVRESSGDSAGNILCSLSNEGTQLIFELGSSTLFLTRILDGTYPPYTKIIPTSYATRVIFTSDVFLKTVRTAALFARSGASVIKMTVDASTGVIKLSSSTEQVGEYNGELEVEIEGSSNTIAFNSKYLLEFLAKIKNSELIFEMNGPNQPGIWRMPDFPDYLHVIMPVRTDAV